MVQLLNLIFYKSFFLNKPVLIENLKGMNLDPEEFEFYVAGFRHGVPPHAGWGLGVERILMKLTGAKNVRETVLFPRDRRRVSP